MITSKSSPNSAATIGTSASIAWGDDTTSSGAISATGSSFAVRGSHTYATGTGGLRTITVTITAADGRTVQATTTSSVSG